MGQMNVIEKYEDLVAREQWQDAIPVIQEIIQRNPDLDTSWFNYGVCLDEVGQHGKAAEAFIKAHELNVSDYGIHYRIMRSLMLAEDYPQLHEFVDYLCQTFEEERSVIFASDEFSVVFKRREFVELKEKYCEK